MSIHPAVQPLFDEIEAFLARTGISATAFGAGSVKDPGLVGDLRNGRSPGLATVDRIRAFMREREGVSA